MDPTLRQRAVMSEDAFDAAVSATVMSQHSAGLATLEQAAQSRALLEGTIWDPRLG